MKASSFKENSSHRAFTLIEVVISLAVVTLALIAVMGLMAVFLQGTKNVVERNEALSICQALNAYLQMPTTTVPVKQGFDKVYSWVQNGQIPQLYAFIIPVQVNGQNPATYAPNGGIPQMQVTASTDPTYAYIGNRISRLYYISLSLSPNVPIHQGVGRVATYNPTSLPMSMTCYPASTSDKLFYADTSLSLSVRVYVLPTATTLTASQLQTQNFNYPILMYDTAINR